MKGEYLTEEEDQERAILNAVWQVLHLGLRQLENPRRVSLLMELQSQVTQAWVDIQQVINEEPDAG